MTGIFFSSSFSPVKQHEGQTDLYIQSVGSTPSCYSVMRDEPDRPNGGAIKLHVLFYPSEMRIFFSAIPYKITIRPFSYACLYLRICIMSKAFCKPVLRVLSLNPNY